MDASDEARLRQLMLGSDSEDELDATQAAPVPKAATAPPVTAPSTRSTANP